MVDGLVTAAGELSSLHPQLVPPQALRRCAWPDQGSASSGEELFVWGRRCVGWRWWPGGALQDGVSSHRQLRQRQAQELGRARAGVPLGQSRTQGSRTTDNWSTGRALQGTRFLGDNACYILLKCQSV